MSKSTVEILREARALIDTPEKWCKKHYAKDAAGNLANPLDPDACQRCAEGALMRACCGVDRPADALVKAIFAMCDNKSVFSLIGFNDKPSTTHADVMDLFDRRIAAEEKAGG